MKFFGKLIFSDEAKTKLFGKDRKEQIVWRKANTEHFVHNTGYSV